MANVSAILMGEAARIDPNLYSASLVFDRDGNRHASVQFSIVILEANGSQQIANQVLRIRDEYPELACSLFSSEGQTLNNAFSDYAALIASKRTSDLSAVGLMVTGEDSQVRAATKKFSLAH